MPFKSPRVCGCGKVVPSGIACECQKRRKALIDKLRPTARERGYDTKWDKARAGYLSAHPDCHRCPNPATVVDHKIPHDGNMKLFWDHNNWQPLCAPCHNSWKQSQERKAVSPYA